MTLFASLLLAFASVYVTSTHANHVVASHMAVSIGPDSAGSPLARAGRPQALSALLAPWAYTTDAIAVLGLAVVLVVRSRARS